jgi:Tfp pilus assembly protein PilE
MPTNSNTKLIVLAIILAVLAGAGLLLGVVLLPSYLQARREAARREECNNQLRQIAEALEQYSKKRDAMPSADSIDPKVKLTFNTYNGYFVSNQFEPDATESFAVITNQAQFDKIFGVAMVMGDKSHRLPADAFKANIVLAVVKRGDAVCEYTVKDATLDDGVLTLRYSTVSKKSDSATFASPLIVSIPKVKHTAVQFIENEKPVKKMKH